MEAEVIAAIGSLSGKLERLHQEQVRLALSREMLGRRPGAVERELAEIRVELDNLAHFVRSHQVQVLQRVAGVVETAAESPEVADEIMSALAPQACAAADSFGF